MIEEIADAKEDDEYNAYCEKCGVYLDGFVDCPECGHWN